MEIVAGIGSVLGLVIFFTLQAKKQKAMRGKILEILADGERKLPDIVTGLGMKDGFYNRGKAMNTIQMMVTSGELYQTEPPGTTIKNRLDVLSFGIKKS